MSFNPEMFGGKIQPLHYDGDPEPWEIVLRMLTGGGSKSSDKQEKPRPEPKPTPTSTQK